MNDAPSSNADFFNYDTYLAHLRKQLEDAQAQSSTPFKQVAGPPPTKMAPSLLGLRQTALGNGGAL